MSSRGTDIGDLVFKKLCECRSRVWVDYITVGQCKQLSLCQSVFESGLSLMTEGQYSVYLWLNTCHCKANCSHHL